MERAGYDGGMRNKIRKTLDYILTMRPEAWSILIGTLRLSCTMLFCAFVLMIDLQQPTMATLPIWRGALEYASFPAILLLCAVIASALVDEHLR